MNDALREKIEFFFRQPTLSRPAPQDGASSLSTLYMLRSELQSCLFGEVRDEEVALEMAGDRRERVMTSAMVIYAGIELLAQFAVTGNTPAADDEGQKSWRFREFLKEFASLSDVDIVTLLAFRNAFAHSFSFHHIDKKMGRVRLTMFWNWSRDEPPCSRVGDLWQLNLDGLFRMFTASIRTYRARLENNEGLQAAFEQAFDKSGRFFFGHPRKEDFTKGGE